MTGSRPDTISSIHDTLRFPVSPCYGACVMNKPNKTPIVSEDGRWQWDGQQWRPRSPRAARPPIRHKGALIAGAIVGALLIIMTGVGIIAAATTPQSPAAATGTAPSSTPTSKPKPTAQPTAKPTPARITAAQKAHVQQVLQAAIDHYAQEFAAGQAAVGTTPYPDSRAGLIAFGDPNSAASKFRDWRASSRAEFDMSFLAAFKDADSAYNADNEPQSIGPWRDDMSDMQTAIVEWVHVAASWQISAKSDAELRTAAQAVSDGLALASKDLASVLAAS